jgi:transposase
LCKHLQKRYGEPFGTKFDFLICDITSTYFEGNAKDNTQAKRGYSRDGRPDCMQVCIGLVASAEGLPLAFEVFEGNRADVTTVEDMVDLMQDKYGKAQRICVMDRGMVSEEYIESLQDCGARHLVGTPKPMLRKFEHELIDKDWQEVQPGVEVKLCPATAGTEERFVLCRSEWRKDKEMAILNRFITRLEAGIDKLKQQAESGRLRDRQKAERRIGRLLERNSRAAALFDITVAQQGSANQRRLHITIKKHEDRYEWLLATSGSYLLRTNWTENDPRQIRKTYIQLTQVEDAFRTTKSDLGMRPIYHYKAHRTQAYILVCFLSPVLWRTLQQWMDCSGLGTAPRKLREELREITSLDVVLPTRDNKKIRLRVISTAPPGLKILLQRLKLPLPGRPKVIENVVPTLAD